MIKATIIFPLVLLNGYFYRAIRCHRHLIAELYLNIHMYEQIPVADRTARFIIRL